jgi:hypothetical protein
VHQAKAMNDLNSVCRDVVWRTTKFITSVPQENRFAKAILDRTSQVIRVKAVVATARAWLAIYQDRCLNKLNVCAATSSEECVRFASIL